MFKFEELRVYQVTLELNDDIYLLTKKFPKDEMFGLTNQLRRASVSVSLNIAEGTSRTKKDFRHFLDIARGSCFECVAVLTIAKRRNYITEKEFTKNCEGYLVATKMINALKTSLLP